MDRTAGENPASDAAVRARAPRKGTKAVIIPQAAVARDQTVTQPAAIRTLGPLSMANASGRPATA